MIGDENGGSSICEQTGDDRDNRDNRDDRDDVGRMDGRGAPGAFNWWPGRSETATDQTARARVRVQMLARHAPTCRH